MKFGSNNSQVNKKKNLLLLIIYQQNNLFDKGDGEIAISGLEQWVFHTFELPSLHHDDDVEHETTNEGSSSSRIGLKNGTLLQAKWPLLYVELIKLANPTQVVVISDSMYDYVMFTTTIISGDNNNKIRLSAYNIQIGKIQLLESISLTQALPVGLNQFEINGWISASSSSLNRLRHYYLYKSISGLGYVQYTLFRYAFRDL